jgi:hypothetical protein
MSAYPSDRLSKLMTAARQSPHFGVRLLAELAPEARAEAIRRWCVAGPSEPSVAPRPGLKKCATPIAAPDAGLGAELAAFGRTIRRVGNQR